MNTLIEKSFQKVRDVDTRFVRSIMNKIDWNERLTGIRGARGVGKTTLLLQRIKTTLGNTGGCGQRSMKKQAATANSEAAEDTAIPPNDTYGHWEMLTIENGDTTIFSPCGYQNRAIIHTKDFLTDIAGQEDIKCRIVSTFAKGGKAFVVLEPDCLYANT